MNRLTRTALTLFASASVLIFLVAKRLEVARTLVSEAAQAEEIKMANLGLGLAGVMLAIGLGLIVTVLVRSRKAKKPADHG